MGTALITGGFTALGAVIGVLGSFLNNLLSNRNQAATRDEARSEREAENRRTCYATVLIAIYQVMDQTSQLVEAVKYGSKMAEVDEIYYQCDNAWRVMVEAVAAAEIVGPLPVAQQVRDLKDIIYWYTAESWEYRDAYRENRNPTSDEDAISSKFAEYETGRDRFRSLALQYGSPTAAQGSTVTGAAGGLSRRP